MPRQRGRKPVPTHLKVLRGNPGHRSLNKDEPVVSGEMPDPPDDISPQALQIWHREAPLLHESGLLTKLDRKMFHLYCESEARWQEAIDQIREVGMLVKDRFGAPKRNPYYDIMLREQDQMQKILTGFGQDPASRSRLIVKARTEQTPGLEDMLTGST